MLHRWCNLRPGPDLVFFPQRIQFHLFRVHLDFCGNKNLVILLNRESRAGMDLAGSALEV
jgi:hypothetical protein